YVPAFCPQGIAPECARQAAQAYAEAVIFSAGVIRELDPGARIVFGGPGGGTSDEEYEYFYRPALTSLASRIPGGGFDFFDYHNFNTYQEYASNSRGKGLEFFRKMLADAGLPAKPMIIKAGATHSGQDQEADNKRLHEPQTEAQQAEYLIKRYVYHVANGVSLILWGDVREDENEHSTYSHNGLMYNGIPRIGACTAQSESPCPDPGDGVKKLSYYASKFLIEKTKGVDFGAVKSIATSIANVCLYELPRSEQTPIYIAWLDDYSRASGKSKEVTLELPGLSAVSPGAAKITRAIPDFPSDFQTSLQKLADTDYPSFFRSTLYNLNGKTISFDLTKTPVYIEAATLAK
ncbi:MAG TPA: hypothetical protein VJ521_04115, partial [Acidobacteriota bacterium]|nr:hypothetical protein [Acidobacteriota bacterium]